jgi:adenylate kinase family enzyme
VAWLTAADELPARPARVLIAGTSGSGKSTLARHISAVLGIPYVELDALHHGPGWTVRPHFVEDVAELATAAEWVTEWQYNNVRELLADRADLLVWLDLPRRVVIARVVRRTAIRRLRRIELWNGNREPPLYTIVSDRDHIIRWAWRTHSESLRHVTSCAAHRPELPVVHLRSPAEAEAWVTGPLFHAAQPDF